jgi:hypothetical protein
VSGASPRDPVRKVCCRRQAVHPRRCLWLCGCHPFFFFSISVLLLHPLPCPPPLHWLASIPARACCASLSVSMSRFVPELVWMLILCGTRVTGASPHPKKSVAAKQPFEWGDMPAAPACHSPCTHMNTPCQSASVPPLSSTALSNTLCVRLLVLPRLQRKFYQKTDRVKSVDIHPTEPWVLTSLYSGHVVIWNYTTQSAVKSFEVTELPIRAGKFIPRKQWIVTGSDDMMIRAYNINTQERVTEIHGVWHRGWFEGLPTLFPPPADPPLPPPPGTTPSPVASLCAQYHSSHDAVLGSCAVCCVCVVSLWTPRTLWMCNCFPQ